MKRKNIKNIQYLNWSLVIIGFFYWAIPSLNHALWWDEINSFLYYSLHDTNHTLTSLKTANNHILFNYVMNIFSSIIKTRNIDEILLSPYLFRLLMLISSLLSVFFLYKAATKLGGKDAGIITAVLLITSIPFVNYSLQLRGYGFSILFLSAALYFVLSYQENGKFIDMLFIPISIFLFLFTLISNIYILLSLVFVVLIQWAVQLFYKKRTELNHGEEI